MLCCQPSDYPLHISKVILVACYPGLPARSHPVAVAVTRSRRRTPWAFCRPFVSCFSAALPSHSGHWLLSAGLRAPLDRYRTVSPRGLGPPWTPRNPYQLQSLLLVVGTTWRPGRNSNLSPRRSRGAALILSPRSVGVSAQHVSPVGRGNPSATALCPAAQHAQAYTGQNASMTRTRTTGGKASIVRRSIAARPGAQLSRSSSRPS